MNLGMPVFYNSKKCSLNFLLIKGRSINLLGVNFWGGRASFLCSLEKIYCEKKSSNDLKLLCNT